MLIYMPKENKRAYGFAYHKHEQEAQGDHISGHAPFEVPKKSITPDPDYPYRAKSKEGKYANKKVGARYVCPFCHEQYIVKFPGMNYCSAVCLKKSLEGSY